MIGATTRKYPRKVDLMVKYRLFEEIREINGIETVVYGIAAFDDTGDIVGLATNITPTKEKALKLLDKCIRLKVSPCHLSDIAEDFVISDDY